MQKSLKYLEVRTSLYVELHQEYKNYVWSLSLLDYFFFDLEQVAWSLCALIPHV